MQLDDLVAMLEDCGFTSIFFHKRYPYRTVGTTAFYSLTYEAKKKSPSVETLVKIVYRGPQPMLVTPSGLQLERGRIVEIPEETARSLGDQVFILDKTGAVTNVEQAPCCCGVAPESQAPEQKNPLPESR